MAQARPDGAAVEEVGTLTKECAEQALFTMISIDEQLYSSGWAPGPGGDPRYDFLLAAFRLEPGLCLASQVKFNMLPRSTRKAFFALVLHRWTIEDCLEEDLGSTKEQLLDSVERAMRALASPLESDHG